MGNLDQFPGKFMFLCRVLKGELYVGDYRVTEALDKNPEIWN